MSHTGAVLVVDDSPDYRVIVSTFLESAGINFELATSAEEADERIKSGGLSLVITDIQMPGKMSGLDLAAKIRARPNAPPVIFLSGYPNLGTKYPAVPLIQKPIKDPRVFLEIVTREIRNYCRDTLAATTHSIATQTHEVSTQTHQLALETHRILGAHVDECESTVKRVVIMEADLKAAKTMAEEAKRRGLLEIVSDFTKNPLIWALLVLAGTFLKMQWYDFQEMKGSFHSIQQTLDDLKKKVK